MTFSQGYVCEYIYGDRLDVRLLKDMVNGSGKYERKMFSKAAYIIRFDSGPKLSLKLLNVQNGLW